MLSKKQLFFLALTCLVNLCHSITLEEQSFYNTFCDLKETCAYQQLTTLARICNDIMTIKPKHLKNVNPEAWLKLIVLSNESTSSLPLFLETIKHHFQNVCKAGFLCEREDLVTTILHILGAKIHNIQVGLDFLEFHWLRAIPGTGQLFFTNKSISQIIADALPHHNISKNLKILTNISCLKKTLINYQKTLQFILKKSQSPVNFPEHIAVYTESISSSSYD
jgi:hypothetical protein